MYTMPPHAPPYPPFPNRFADVTRFVLVCEAPANAVAEIVSPPLLPDIPSSPIEIFFAQLNDTPFGPYLEAGVTVPVRYNDIKGSHHAYMYLNRGGPIIHGRETYGWPKKLASMVLEEKGERVHATVDCDGARLMEFHFDFSEGQPVEPITGRLPRIQVRIVPRVDGPGAESVTVIRTRGSGSVLHSKKFGIGEVSFGRSDRDPLYKLQPLKVLGAIRTHTSGNLDYGEVLARMKGNEI